MMRFVKIGCVCENDEEGREKEEGREGEEEEYIMERSAPFACGCLPRKGLTRREPLRISEVTYLRQWITLFE